MRDKIIFWVVLVWGVALAAFQMYKYVTDTLNDDLYYSVEVAVFCISILLIVKPSIIVNLIKKKANAKDVN